MDSPTGWLLVCVHSIYGPESPHGLPMALSLYLGTMNWKLETGTSYGRTGALLSLRIGDIAASPSGAQSSSFKQEDFQPPPIATVLNAGRQLVKASAYYSLPSIRYQEKLMK